jgi:hypothetical protein
MLRGAPLSPHLQHLVRELLSITTDHGTVGEVLRRIGASESGTRSRFQKKRLPPPRAWCGLARGLRTALSIQGAPDAALTRIAGALGYRDHTALSKQVRLVFAVQPSEIRGTLGWEWLLDRWWSIRAAGRDVPEPLKLRHKAGGLVQARQPYSAGEPSPGRTPGAALERAPHHPLPGGPHAQIGS